MTSSILFKKEDKLAWLMLNRPEKLNALTDEMINELEGILDALKEEKEVHVLVILGSGKNFSSGADLEQLMSLNEVEAESRSRRWKTVFNKLESLSKPTIAAIRGYCLGCGLELALACDFRLASDDAVFGQPEIKLGIIPGASATCRLIKLLGAAKAKELLMLGELIDAKRAVEIGLVTKLISGERFEEEVRRFAFILAGLPQKALKSLKYAIMLASNGRFSEVSEFESKVFGDLAGSREFKERARRMFRKSIKEDS